ncbi:MFS transporter [Bradyrhizobium sp. U87765 SZCCT0131]|uniref:MFS transporter n=1 Tax=unclassified Bradyrhizobium TaxID=2631580 RepID=UPI001BA77954|nr:MULTISPECIES: MFS transporter [unclassified Bradyrhizobium]MBR1218051.1 MFS transporter [Bradyrhizobium sp. U87765 SZCCT0131]MBR1261003.1 MFS transporter [Bradyrhizobium sp. U87765 SZCCT0134]MBR1303549.1 MFS transporter [Bradyrhizobium sp. U87765 SZCCT0110]MBR1319155.1 MFS transporter [Bradyrhizobium sp. U87765 SZCCT0109]MBR1347480.1 MFS transporter [Bradyrhizobium sp. U87765 SZCCT0048]
MGESLSAGMQWLLGTACGLLVASLYYAQPLTGLIGPALGMPPGAVGLLVTLPLAGYGVGLLLVVPLGDLVENRRLVLALVALEAGALALVSQLSNAQAFLSASFMVGLAASAVQVLVPYVTYLAPEAIRGRAVGRVVSGVMLGIMLARPVSSMVAHLWSWRTIFGISSAAMLILFAMLRMFLPPRAPAPGLSYRALLLSLGDIFIHTEVLRRRAFYHACMFGAFSVFWTAVPLWLSGPRFGLSQSGIAWVAFAGVAGAIAPPFAGHMADRGFSRLGTICAMLLASTAFLLSDLALATPAPLGLGLIVAAAIGLDFAVSANLVFCQRAIYALDVERRSRINGLFMASFFAGGAVSSAVSGWCYSRWGWPGVSALGVAMPILALCYLAGERGAAPTPSGEEPRQANAA